MEPSRFVASWPNPCANVVWVHSNAIMADPARTFTAENLLDRARVIQLILAGGRSTSSPATHGAQGRRTGKYQIKPKHSGDVRTHFGCTGGVRKMKIAIAQPLKNTGRNACGTGVE